MSANERTQPPPATPDTQSAPRAKAGGTDAPSDHSRSAQRSHARTTAPESLGTGLEPPRGPERPKP
jgi:hypothetical protein